MWRTVLICTLMIAALVLSACGSVQRSSEEVGKKVGSDDAGKSVTSEASGIASATPEYRIMSEEDFPLRDADGSIPAKSLVVHTEETSDSALRRITEDIDVKEDYADQDAIGITFGDLLNTESKNPESDFVVMVRNGRAARALGLTGEEFEDGGIAVNPEVAEQAATAKASATATAAASATASASAAVKKVTFRLTGTPGTRVQLTMMTMTKTQDVRTTVPDEYTLPYQPNSGYEMVNGTVIVKGRGTAKLEIINHEGKVVRSTTAEGSFGIGDITWTP